MMSGRSLRLGAGLCFFVSGVAGLLYEVVWARMLGLVFGHTIFAISTVLAAFMAGLAVGAALFGRLIDRRGRPLRMYGFLEAGIGLYALLVPFLFDQAQGVYLRAYRSLGFSLPGLIAAQFALVFVILVVPTSLMGATLPVMSRFFVTRLEGLGRKIANLYALNTFGAVVGSTAAGFFLLPGIGVRTTIILAAGLNLGAGVWALTADRWHRSASQFVRGDIAKEDAASSAASEARADLVTWVVVAGIGVSGAVAMIYEVAWTRALSLVAGSSIYAFSAMLTTFLVGLALGSFLFARVWGKRAPSASLLGWIEIAIGIAALALIPAFGRMPELLVVVMQRLSPSPGTAILSQFALSFLAMIVPATLIGAALPCAIHVCATDLTRLGRDVSRVYSVNTGGTIAGALLAGYVLVPFLGLQATLTSAAAANVAIGVAIAAVAPGVGAAWRVAAPLTAVALFTGGVFLVSPWDRGMMVSGVSVYAPRLAANQDPRARLRQETASHQLLFYREGLNSTISVDRTQYTTALKVNGKVDASDGLDMLTQLMLGHLPMLVHPRAERVLVIGLGSGVTAGAVAQHPEAHEIDVIELEPAVVEGARFFARENRGVLRDPRLRIVLGDGRNYILATAKRYDVISSEPSNPWMAGVANLFSREFYRLARERLADDGIMVQWLHGYSLFPRDFRMIVATFRGVFPHATLWRTIRGDYLLLGTVRPLVLDYAVMEQRIAASATVREDLESLQLRSPVDLLTLFFVDERGLARFAEGALENTDDRPLLEFAAPLALYAETTDENSRLLHEARVEELPAISHLPDGVLSSRRAHFARLYWARGELADARDQLARAPRPGVDDVAGRLDRAKLRFSLGQVSEAAAELARLAERRPGDQLVRSYLKAAAMLRRFGGEDALASHARTRFGNPNPAEAHNNLGVFYIQLGISSGEAAFFDLAADALETARRIEPQAVAVMNNLGNAYFEIGHLEEAERAYRQVIVLAPGEAQPRFNLGLVYEKRGLLREAALEFETASALRPDWPLPRTRLAQLRGGGVKR